MKFPHCGLVNMAKFYKVETLQKEGNCTSYQTGLFRFGSLYLFANATVDNCTPRDEMSIGSRQMMVEFNLRDQIFLPFDV